MSCGCTCHLGNDSDNGNYRPGWFRNGCWACAENHLTAPPTAKSEERAGSPT
jgi:hypothetical protein